VTQLRAIANNIRTIMNNANCQIDQDYKDDLELLDEDELDESSDESDESDDASRVDEDLFEHDQYRPVPRRYSEVKRCFHGNFGQVSVRRDELLHRDVVLKATSNPGFAAYLSTEANALVTICSKHVVELYDLTCFAMRRATTL
jgi:hypothetical protein